MKNSKKYVIIVVIMIILVRIPLAVVSTNRRTIDNHLNNIPCNSEQLPNYVLDGILYIGENSYDVDDICSETYNGYYVVEIFSVNDNKGYFVAEKKVENNKFDWILTEFSLNDSNDITVLAHLNQVDRKYCFERGKEYKNRNGYLYNDRIVLNDFNRVVEYNLSTKEICNSLYSEYLFPDSEVIGRYIDSNTIELEALNNTNRYDLAELAENNESLSDVYKLKDKIIWDGDSSLCEFFSENSISIIDDKVRVIGQCLNYSGEAHAIILEYDYRHDSWEYLGNVFTCDGVSYGFYVI